MNNKSRGLERDKRNIERTSYNFEDLTMLIQISSRICVFCKVRKQVIIEFPLINNEVKDGFVRYMAQ
jgi:thioredoxin-related protein